MGVRGSRWSEAVCIPNSRCRALCIFHGDPEFPGTPEPDMHPELATAAEPCKSSGDARELPTPKLLPVPVPARETRSRCNSNADFGILRSSWKK